MVLVIGNEQAPLWADNVFAASAGNKNFSQWGGDPQGAVPFRKVDSVVAIAEPVKMSTVAGTNGTEVRGKLTFSENTLVVINASKAIDTPFFRGTTGGLVFAGNNVRLLLDGAKGEQTYLIAENMGLANIADEKGNAVKSWGNLEDAEAEAVQLYGSKLYAYRASNIVWNDKMFMYTLEEADNGAGGTNLVVRARVRDPEDIYPGITLSSTIREIWKEGLNDISSDDRAIAFLSRANDENYLPSKDVVTVVNGAVQLATLAGVQNTSFQASGKASQAIENHLSLSAH